MTETFYRIMLLFVFVGFFTWGGSIKVQTEKYTVQKPRHMMMVDAYEQYNENGKPSWTGIFRDNEFNTRLEYGIEPKTYREFVGSNSQPREMIVKASLEKVEHPKTPKAAIFWSTVLMFVGFFGILYNLFAVFFLRDPWRFS